MAISDGKIIRVYRKMLEIRRFEEAAIESFHQKLWKGSLHTCIGQEAIAAAIGAAIEERDFLVSSHRGHGHLLAKGVCPKLFMAELFGRVTGHCHGRGGSMHAMSSEKRVYPHGLVGSGTYIAAGIGLAIQLKKKDEVVVCSFGDGAINAGGCHEGLNLAAVHKVPAIFVCENNRIAVSTRIEQVLPIKRISDRAAAYGMSGETVDGTDAIAVFESVKKAVDKARNGGGPSLIEALCYRMRGHTAWDPATYRTPKENDEWQEHDPIDILGKEILSRKIATEEEMCEWDKEFRNLMAEAVEFAKNSPMPDLTREEAMKYVYA